VSQIDKVDPGRVDHLAKGIFYRLLQKHGNPELRFTCKMLQDEIAECFEEHLGPGTKAHEVGKRIMRALGDGR
jgi:hypothetical protein